MPSSIQTASTGSDRMLAKIVATVIVNRHVCRSLSKWIAAHDVPADREDSSLSGMSPEQVGNFYLLLVAICHQTSPRGKQSLQGDVNGHHLRGWDYLSAKLEAAARINPEILCPVYWTNVTVEQVCNIFRDAKLGDTLSDPERRTMLIRDLGEKMRQNKLDCADQLYQRTQGRIATGEANLLQLLASFRAYDDPVHKKSYFFLALMKNSGLWSYVDHDRLGAPVDYHEVRGHLRIGTIQIRDPELRKRLIAGGEVTAEEDISIRQAVHEAIMLISQQSGLRNPSQLHYLFWNVFRSCCTREVPHCEGCPTACSLPERYVPLALDATGKRRCPFSTVCQSVGREPKLLDYQFDTDYY